MPPLNGPLNFEEPARPTVERRDFLKLMGAVTALATGCTRNHLPVEHILSLRDENADRGLSAPVFYTTAFPVLGLEQGLVVKTQAGRPIKIDGNPKIPGQVGACHIFAQASLLDLYSPFRLREVKRRVDANVSSTSWPAFLSAYQGSSKPPPESTTLPAVQKSRPGSSDAGEASAKGRTKIRAILVEGVNSPTLARQLHQLKRLGDSNEGVNSSAGFEVYEHAVFSSLPERIGTLQASGQIARAQLSFAKVRYVLSIDCDFMGLEADALTMAASFMKRRLEASPSPIVLDQVESGVSLTGLKADRRQAQARGEIEDLLEELAAEFVSPENKSGTARTNRGEIEGSSPRSKSSPQIRDLQARLKKYGSSSVVLIGRDLSPRCHELGYRLNHALGAIGIGVRYRRESELFSARPLSELITQMRAGEIESLLVIGGNPALSAPADFQFPKLLSQIPLTAHLCETENETSELCQWRLPKAHYLEHWSDLVLSPDRVAILQPVIQPESEARSDHELLDWIIAGHVRGDSQLAPERARDSAYRLVRETFFNLREPKRSPFSTAQELKWKNALLAGFVETFTTNDVSALKPFLARKQGQSQGQSQGQIRGQIRGQNQPQNVAQADRGSGANPTAGVGGIELLITPDATVWDGRFGDNPWLQELPKPPTSLTWDNALLISPSLAVEYRLQTGSKVRIATALASTELAVCVIEGLPAQTVLLSTGYGRRHATPVAEGAGFDAFAFVTSQGGFRAELTRFERIEGSYELAQTQAHHELNQPSLFKKRDGESHRDLGWGDFENPDALLKPQTRQWGMTIDLESCIGCAACVVACQAENNVPVVGKRQVLAGREMHWIRIDRYSTADRPLQPIPITCMHCETAPCEYVCPVAATSHSSEGLNQMVYNRCVGTRYCSNNCPYKVRRFNFYQFSDAENGPGPRLSPRQRNPEVTVRSRGVMEKCSYCVQRIEHAEIKAQLGQKSAINELQTACQQSCPTRAIRFGDIKDRNSDVFKMKSSARNFGLLTELNTRPRTTYLEPLPSSKEPS